MAPFSLKTDPTELESRTRSVRYKDKVGGLACEPLGQARFSWLDSVTLHGSLLVPGQRLGCLTGDSESGATSPAQGLLTGVWCTPTPAGAWGSAHVAPAGETPGGRKSHFLSPAASQPAAEYG